MCLWQIGLVSMMAAGQNANPQRLPLWEGTPPLTKGNNDQDRPMITVYLPAKEKAAGSAIVVLPGGGYGGLALGHEGKEIADWLTSRGVAAFVLEYRLGPRNRFPIPLVDAQRAVRWVRFNANKYGLDQGRIGIWGFSAGGHLASTVSTRHDEGNREAEDPVDRVSCRPDLAILCYPVIRLDPPHGHEGSRRNLLGDKADPELVKSLCNDTQVNGKTPPTFLFHTKADKPVPVENSLLYYKALIKAGVPAELVLYDEGPHGVGLGYKHPSVKDWPVKLENWLKKRKMIGSFSKE